MVIKPMTNSGLQVAILTYQDVVMPPPPHHVSQQTSVM